METVLPLIGLALVDSLSVGTLVVPLGLTDPHEAWERVGR